MTLLTKIVAGLAIGTSAAAVFLYSLTKLVALAFNI